MSKHIARRGPVTLRRIGAGVAIASFAGIAGLSAVPTATADTIPGHEAQSICHPVHGLGELKNGWTLIPPDKASSHIDEDLYPDGIYWQHQVVEDDGTVRHDMFAEFDGQGNPVCPGVIVDEELTVAQTITTSFDRDYAWTLTKTALDGPSAAAASLSDLYLYAPAAAGAHSGTVYWKVDASATPTDSNYLVSGSVLVSNTGESDAEFILTLDPAIGAVDCGAGSATAVIAVGADVTCTYSASSQLTGDVKATATTDVDSYDDTDTIDWTGADISVTHDTATLVDSRLGVNQSVDAATGYSQSLPETFNWADKPCGNSTETNTASLSTGETASDSVAIHRQCVVFNGDTAWAKGTTAATAGGTYNATKGNWATYVKGQTGTYQLFAGQTKPAGTVTIGAGGVVTVNLANGFAFAPGTGNIHIQGYATAPKGNPSPGQFALNTTCSGSPCSPGSVALANYYGIHLAVGVWTPDPNFGP